MNSITYHLNKILAIATYSRYNIKKSSLIIITKNERCYINQQIFLFLMEVEKAKFHYLLVRLC
jgi:hypothetical protein